MSLWELQKTEEICIREVIKYHHLNLTFGVLSIPLHDSHT